jgi:hypothetical protein
MSEQEFLRLLTTVVNLNRRFRDPFVSWDAVARELTGTSDKGVELSGLAELEPYCRYLNQTSNRWGVTLSSSGRAAVQLNRIEELTKGAPPAKYWIYFNRYMPGEPPRVMAHNSTCMHCDDGNGQGGHATRREPPGDTGRWLPTTAWVGRFSSLTELDDYCLAHRDIRTHPQRCAHCIGNPNG